MLNWLGQNYKWVFDGIGVAILAWVGAHLYRRGRPQSNPAPSLSLAMAGARTANSNVAVGSNIAQTVNVTNTITQSRASIRERRPTGPTPEEARQYQDGLPPYQQNDAMRHYFGERIGLPVEFVSITPLNQGRWMMMFHYYGSDNRSYTVYGYFEDDPTKQYPRLRTLPRDSWVWIEGEIGLRADLFSVSIHSIEFD